MSLKLQYGISYPIDDHKGIMELLGDSLTNSQTIVAELDNELTPNRGFIYVRKTRLYSVDNGAGSSYINFYPVELKKLELTYAKQLSEINEIYDRLIVEYTPETFHLGWSTHLTRGELVII